MNSTTATSATAGTKTITATNVQVPAAASCTVTVAVTNVAGATNASCSPAVAAFTNAKTSVTGVTGTTNNVVDQCLVVLAPVITATKAASASPLVVGASGQFYNITVTVATTATTAALSIADALPTGITLSGTPTLVAGTSNATAGSLTGCPAAGNNNTTGCSVASGISTGTFVIRIPITVAAGAVGTSGGNNTANLAGGGDPACTAVTGQACDPTTPTVGVIQNPVITLQKALGGSGRISAADQFTVAIRTGGVAGTVVNSTANSTTAGAVGTVTPGSGTTGAFDGTAGTAYTLTEAMAGGSTSALNAYTSTILCTDTSGLQTGLPTTATAYDQATGHTITNPVAGANIVCTVTNTPTASVVLRKTWRNGTDNNGTTSTTTIPAITAGMITPTGTVNSTSGATPPSNNSDSSTPGTAAVGATLTLPVEILGDPNTDPNTVAARFGVGAAAPVYSCTDGTTTVNNIVQGGTVTVPASSANGTLTCTLTNAALPVVVLAKAARAGSQSPTFNFTVNGATNGSAAFAFTPNNSVVTQYATQEHRGTVGTAVVITELSTPNWPSAPTSAVCTDLNAANSGNPSSIPVGPAGGSTYTVPAANMVLGANIQCVFTNDQPQITLNKIFVGTARDSGNFTLRISGTNSQPGNADVTAPATFASGGGGTPFAWVNAGQTVTLSEMAGTGTSLSNYTATISCNGGIPTPTPTSGVPGSWTLTVPISSNSKFIRCDITNTAPTTLQLNKTWAANSTAGDQITVTTTGGSTNPTLSSTATAAASPTTTAGSPATVTVGNTINLPAETFTPASSAANYTTSLACTAGTLSPDNQGGNNLVMGAADAGKAIVCTYTNTPKPLNIFRLRLRKIFTDNISPNDTITATTTGGTFSGSPSNPTLTADALGGSTPTTGASVFVTQGNAITLLAENFTTGSQANYTTTVSCNNNVSPVTNATLPHTFTVSSVEPSITCVYTNTVKAPTVTLAKKSIGGIGKFDFTLAGVTNTTDTVTTSTAGTTVTSGTVQVGAAGTAATMTETSASATGYSTAVSCVDANSAATGNTGSIGATGTSFTIPAANMKVAAQYTCTFTNTASTGLRVQIVKTTTSGTGSNLFSFALSGLSQSSDTIRVVDAATVSGLATITGTPNTAVTITETSPAGWPANPVSASCRDSASATPLMPFGTLTGNALSIPAANMVTGANITCTFTNAFSFSVTGRVFNDNGVGAGTANDGVINGSEAGVAGVSVRLTNCAATVLSAATTDSSGTYSLSVPFSTAANAPLCVEETNPASSVSTGASVGSAALPSGTPVLLGGTTYTYTRTGTPDRIAFTFNGTGHAGLNFGDVSLNTFATDGAKTGLAGNTVSYAHTFTAQTGGSVSFGIASAVATPVVSGWGEKIFADAGCIGSLQPGAALLYPPAAAVTVVAAQTVCIIVQEFIPATALENYKNTVTVQANFSFTNAAPALTASYTVVDTTTVSSSALDLKKEVRNVTQSGVFGFNNQAKSGETLEYRITYTNNGPSPITGLSVTDVTPNFTTFISATDDVTPISLTSCQKQTPANPATAPTVSCATAQTAGGTGPVSLRFIGSVNSGATGTVLFQVKVD